MQALAAPPPTEAAKGDEEPGLPSGSQAEPQNVTLIQPDQVDAFSGAWPCLQEQLRLVSHARLGDAWVRRTVPGLTSSAALAGGGGPAGSLRFAPRTGPG